MASRVKISTDKVKRAERVRSPYIRVTAVLGWIDSNWYQYWVKGLEKVTPNPVAEATRIGDESAAFGTGVHKIIECYLRKEPLTEVFTPRQHECAGHLIQWINETGAVPLIIDGKPAIEFEVVSESLGLIGHFDAVLVINGFNYIVDWKTSSKIKKANALQLSAYAKMLHIQYGIDVNNGAVLRVEKDPSKEGQFEVAEYAELKEKYWPIFKKALDVYAYFNNKLEWALKKKRSK